MKFSVFYQDGSPVLLTKQEERLANNLERSIKNALGYEVQITTLTTIMKKISEQKFYQVPFADYVPVKVGEGAWSSFLTTYRSFMVGDEFDTGIVNTGGDNARLASADAAVDALTIPVKNWAKEISWNIMDLELASRSGNWDLITAKEEARKQNWDLGLQKTAFLGLKDGTALGLYNQANVNVDAGTIIPKPISAMSESELNTFLKVILADYRANCAYTAFPTHFIVPESDFLGLTAPSSATFPLKSKMALLLETFQVMTNNPQFKILPASYGMASMSSGILSKDRYILTRYDEKSIRMDVPVNYTNTLANSTNNFSFQNVGYGQFTGVLAYRPRETKYYDLP